MSINNYNIRPISENDIFELLKWKNKYREYFFHKNMISKNEQLIWHSKYIHDKKNTIYVIENKQSLIGCIGVYNNIKSIEIYNVILGDDSYKSSGTMSYLLNYINNLYDKDIYVKVLNANPSMGWYEKNNFKLVSKFNDYSLLILEK